MIRKIVTALFPTDFLKKGKTLGVICYFLH
ncbi:MAG: hypothetical protein ACJAZP_002271 [Psychromonas sp.]|jgi:hypothetical protein